MVQLIVGNKGKGKTRCLLDKVNSDVKSILGSICYLDKSTKHMFELNNRVRLICVPDYKIANTDMFLGFVAGIISQDRDLEQMYFDSFLKIACLEAIAFSKGWLSAVQLREIARPMAKNPYGQYLLDLADGRIQLAE